MRWCAWRVAVAIAVVAGCGPAIPARFVLERDIGSLSYRRYQRVLDVEFPVEGNAAIGHTATYVRRSARGEVPYVNVFVTAYESAPGLASEIRRQVRTLESYDVRVADVGGRAWSLDGGEGDRWFLWVSSSRVIKVGGLADDALLRSVVSEYMGVYPSDLDEHGRARDGAASAGETRAESAADGEDLELPRSLSSGDPGNE